MKFLYSTKSAEAFLGYQSNHSVSRAADSLGIKPVVINGNFYWKRPDLERMEKRVQEKRGRKKGSACI